MTNLSYQDVPYRTAFDSQFDLSLPLAHLRGNKIGFFIRNIEGDLVRGDLEMSYWKFEKDKPYTGRVHISPPPLCELFLIEDFVVGKMPKGYPRIGERTTSKDEVNLSLHYPSNELWNFKIHYTNKEQLVDREAKHLIAEARIYYNNCGDYTTRESAIYVPPREVVQIEDGKWATKAS